MSSFSRKVLRTGGMAALLVILCVGAMAQAKRTFQAGELVVWVKSGAGTINDVKKAVAGVRGEVLRPLGREDVYQLRVLNAQGGIAADDETVKAVESLRQNPMFRYVGTNELYYALDTTPNDPQYPQQWHLPLMNMPKAWDVRCKPTV